MMGAVGDRMLGVDVSAPDRSERQLGAVRILRSIIKSWYWIALLGAVVGVLAMFASLMQRPIYEAKTVLYVTSGSAPDAMSAYQGSLASQQRVASYAQLARSEVILRRAVEISGSSQSVANAATTVSAVADPETVLLTVSVRGHDPNQAAQFANAVGAALVSYVSTLEKPSSGGAPLAKLTVISPAQVPVEPVSPKVLRNSLLGVLAGIVIAICFILVRLRTDTRIHSESDAASSIGEPVLGTIPFDDLLARDGGVLDFRSGASHSAEAYRRLRVSLGFVSVDSPPRVILVASGGAGEGKTTAAVNLGIALSEGGARVLLIDCDLRNPQLSARIGSNPSTGLTSCLRGDADFYDVVQESTLPGVSVLAAGGRAPNPTELLGSEKAQRVFEFARSEFDYVIVDSPPILAVADGLVLTKLCDGVVFVVRADSSKIPVTVKAIEDFRSSHARILGLLVNAVTRDISRYGYGYGYGDNHGSADPVDLTKGGGKLDAVVGDVRPPQR